MLRLGDSNIDTLRVGSRVPTRAYQGDDLVWVLDPVTMTVEGTAFEPQLELAAGSSATVQWVDENDVVIGTGLTPTITWADAGPHTVKLLPSSPEDVVTFNIGFHEYQDNGLYSLPSSYRYPTQPVTHIDKLQNLTGLRRFMASRTDGINSDGSLYTGPVLQGNLNFSGMNTLEYIECYQTQVESVILEGCNALLRLCLEQCNLTTLDINPVRNTLLDLRCAAQAGDKLTLVPLEGPLPMLYHFCSRRQHFPYFPKVENYMPAIRQLWIWQDGLDEDEIVVRSDDNLHSVILSGSDSGGGAANTIRKVDLAGQTWGGLSGPVRMIARGVGMEDIDITGMSAMPEMDLRDNILSTAVIDHVLEVFDSWGTSNGSLDLSGNNPPTTTGASHADNLRARGWTVTHETPRVLLWSDEFDRADAVGFASSGGWYPGFGDTDTDVAIQDGALALSGPASYRTFLHKAGGNLPGNVEVEIGFTITDASEPGAYWGIVDRWFDDQGPGAAGDGIKVIFTTSAKNEVRVGLGRTYSEGSLFDIASGLPAGWNDPGQHSLTLKSQGSRHYVYCDGVQVVDYGRNFYNAVGGAVGFCGEAQGRSWDYIRVYSA